MVKSKTATEWAILKQFQPAIAWQMHRSGCPPFLLENLAILAPRLRSKIAVLVGISGQNFGLTITDEGIEDKSSPPAPPIGTFLKITESNSKVSQSVNLKSPSTPPVSSN